MKFIKKFIANLVEKAVIVSPVLTLFAQTIELLTREVYNLALSVRSLARTIESHQEAIQTLHVQQQMIIRAINAKSMDTALPELFKEKTTKPN